MKLVLAITAICIAVCSGAVNTPPAPTESQLRAVLCSIENADFATARTELEKILKQEPQNTYAQRLMPGVIAGPAKKDDRSQQNIQQIKNAIEAFRQFSKLPQSTADERADADQAVLTLYEMISVEERTNELQRRLTDTTMSPETRARAATSLASESNMCANDIVSAETKPSAAELEKAKSCVAKGLELIDKAIAFNDKDDSAWGYKASLLSSAAKIAELENDRPRKESLQKGQKEAFARSRALSEQRWKEQDKKDLDKIRELSSNNSQPVMPAEMTKELVEYSAEKPIAELIPKLYVPLDLYGFVAPPVLDDGTENGEAKEQDDPAKQKREWKPFQLSSELSLELPDNASHEAPNRAYATSDGINYLLISAPRPAMQTAAIEDAALNTVAWSTVLGTKNLFLRGDNQTRYEVKLLNKDRVAGLPARTYGVKNIGCAKTVDGTLLVLIGKDQNYSILIFGAGPGDPRSDRVSRSMKYSASPN